MARRRRRAERADAGVVGFSDGVANEVCNECIVRSTESKNLAYRHSSSHSWET